MRPSGGHATVDLMADPAPMSSSHPVYRTQRVALAGGERTWTVLDREQRLVEPA